MGEAIQNAMGHDDGFRVSFVRVLGLVMGVVASSIAVLFLLSGEPFSAWIFPLVGGGLGLTSAALAHLGQAPIGFKVIAYGILIDITIFLFVGPLQWHPAAKEVPFFLILLVVFLTPRNESMAFIAWVFVSFVAAGIYHTVRLGNDFQMHLGISDAMTFLMAAIAAAIVHRRADANARELKVRVAELEKVERHARRIADGDLSATADDDIPVVLKQMVASLHDLVKEVTSGVDILATSSRDIAAMATQQKRGAVHQAGAVTQTRETIASLAAASKQIAESTRAVLANAEETLKTSEQAGDHIQALSRHTRRVNELLEFIKDISNKSEILALNAALEGTKAGESGRGFSLVAAQMQRLAESTMATVKDVKALIADITSATNATVLSMEQTTKLARDTTRASREISLITQQQGSSAEQVVEAMSDIATVTHEFAGGSEDTIAAITDVHQLASRLSDRTNRFVIES